MLPMRLPRNTQPQFAITEPSEERRSSTAKGKSAKLPVTSSRPRMTMITRPTGKMRAPTSGCPVVTAPVKAKLVAVPSRAPESAPRMRRSRGDSDSLMRLASIIAFTTSAGFT
jgi:hypothetical protein